MMGITTQIRPAVPQDMPHLIALSELEYNMFELEEPFSPEICERYIYMMMKDPDGCAVVLTDNRNIPFGYLAGSLDFSQMNAKPQAITHHWFVHNPRQVYGRNNYGLQLINTFENWAQTKGATVAMVGIQMNKGHRRAYDRVFGRLGYDASCVYYNKRIR